MATSGGPKIPMDQLSFAVDVSNNKSYSGTGNDWTDLSSNKIIMGSNGTQTPYTTAGGVKCFQFNSSGYWQSEGGHADVDFGGDCSLVFWFYPTNLTERDTIFEKVGYPGYTSYQTEIAVTYESGENFSWYSRRSANYDYGSTTSMTLNTWNLMGIKMSTGKTTAARTGFWSKNGSSWSQNYTSRSNVAVQVAGAIRIGTGYAGAVENGYIGALYCYNKMLSDKEITQFYNATKTRFNLS